MATALAVTIGSRWAGSITPVPSRMRVVCARGCGQDDQRVEGARVLPGQLVVAGGRRGAADDRDVGVLGQVDRVEAAGLGLDGELDGIHRLVGREDGDPEPHGSGLYRRRI